MQHEMTTLKNVTKLICILAIAVTFVNCRGKQEKPEEATPTESTTTPESSAVDSAAMSFDPSGSDSGKIDGLNEAIEPEEQQITIEEKDKSGAE